jgi:hypothetical protein
MRESRTYGFVRGARGNSRPYRVSRCLLAVHDRRESNCREPSHGRERGEATQLYCPAVRCKSENYNEVGQQSLDLRRRLCKI